MERIIQLHQDFYGQLNSNIETRHALKQEGITVLEGFANNIELVRDYYQNFYAMKAQRIVLCGINPGKNGAGKTGIPFIDFKGASLLLSRELKKDQEISAQFVHSIIQAVGSKKFHDQVYVTNLSWFGFIKGKKNLNYYDLPPALIPSFTDSFIMEMEIVQPKVIIPLSKKVEQSLHEMARSGKLNYAIGERLPHPYWCSIGERAVQYKDVYIERINDWGGE